MNLFVVLIVVVIMLIAAVSYAKGQRTKRKAAEAYVKDLQRDLASMAEHNQELQKINRKNSGLKFSACKK
jgi:Tfp pilus assembly protein PilE